ncbi:alpha/beta hydrolase [Pseudonocardia sp. NPDC049635]|uniref:alpha/beta fold hydrolase n=1 Tax=Pseudonocardia sp. NPDC049635 TaxID=3155506 RepID=UPI0033C1077F
MDVYRSEAGRRALQDWCRRELDRALPGAQRRTLETCLGPTHLTTAGSGPGVVLLPGTNFGAATSIPLISALSRSFRVTAVDTPGQPGLSSGRRPVDDLITQHQHWFTQVLRGIGPDTGPLLLIGESLGAVAALCADPAPQIRGLLLVAPAGLIEARVDLVTLRATLPWLLRPTPRRAARLLATMAGGAPIADHDRLVEWMAMVPEHARSSLAPAPLPNVTISAWQHTPCRVVVGEHDRFFPPPRLAEVARTALHAGTRVVPDAGHLVAHTAPEVIVDVAAQLHGVGQDAE